LRGDLSISAFSAARCSLVLRTKPKGRECLYMHLSPPLGQVQSQPYLPSSTALMKYLQTFSVVVLGLPCLERTTCRSLSVSQGGQYSVLLRRAWDRAHRAGTVLVGVRGVGHANLRPNQPCHPSSSPPPPPPACPDTDSSSPPSSPRSNRG